MPRRVWNCLPERQACSEAKDMFIDAATWLSQVHIDELDDDDIETFVQHFGNVMALGIHALRLQRQYLLPMQPPRRHSNRGVTIRQIRDGEDIDHFRFRKDHLRRLVVAFWPKFQAVSGEQDPTSIEVKNRLTVSFEVGFLIMIYRLAHRGRFCDMEDRFDMDVNRLSCICGTFFFYFHAIAAPYLSDLGLFQPRFASYAHNVSVLTKDLVDNIIGFVDGTFSATCRPTYNQRMAYSGHKHMHGIKFQGIVGADGLILHYYGPILGSRHDSFMLRESGVEPRMRELMPLPGFQRPYRLYGDPAYATTAYVLGAFRNTVEGSPEALCNRDMSSARICVEWEFMEIGKSFPFLDVKNQMKIYWNPLTHMHYIAAFLTNFRCIFYGNEQSARYTSAKLTAEEYLALVP